MRMKPIHLLLAALVLVGAHATVARADEMFTPTATLTPERKTGFTLRVVTPVPNPCYVAGPVRMGPPDNVRIASDTVPVRVVIKQRRGMCAQVLSKVTHTQKHLRLGGKTGKNKVIVFAMLDGKVVGSTSVDVPMQTPPPATTTVTTSDWYAWVNKMPPGPASFHVTGTVNLPTPGYDAKLVVASPQGFNPKELILDLVITPKPGVWPQVITPVSVRYDVKDYSGNYTSVLIREPDGDANQTPVEEAH